jgi:O-antigen/teichoic acid export membrane protein
MNKVKLVAYNPFHFLQTAAAHKFVTAIFTQSMLSIVNFLVGFFVIRFATKKEYGIFVILSSITTIVGNYQGAIINVPLTVLLSKKQPEARDLFVSSLGSGQWLFLLPCGILALLCTAAYCFLENDFSFCKYLVPITFAAITYMLREFVRTVNYSKLRTDVLMRIDALYVSIITLGFLYLILSAHVDSVFSTMVLGAGYLFTTLFGLYYEPEIFSFNWEAIKSALRETWPYSRWAVVGNTSSIVFNYGYIYITSLLLGFDELAEIAAARIFLGPVNLFVASSSRIVLAQGAEILSKKGTSRFKQFILSITIFLSLVWLLYFSIIWIFYNQFLSFLGEKYGGIRCLVFFWSIYCLANSLRFSISNTLLVFKEFKASAIYDTIGVVLTITACIILTSSLGSYGAIVASIFGETAMLVLTVRRLLVCMKNENCCVEYTAHL